MFFGAAPELDRYFSELTHRAQANGIHHIVLRVKRIRNPDVVCLERLEHFLKSSERLGLTVLLAGVRPDLLEALRRLHFTDWFPADRIFAQGSDDDSATLAAIRSVYDRLGKTNACDHCVPSRQDTANKLYYLV